MLNKIKKRIIERTKQIATELSLEIINMPDDMMTKPIHLFKFDLKKSIGFKRDLYISEIELKQNKTATSEGAYRSFYRFKIATKQTPGGIFIFSKHNKSKYNWEEKGYIHYEKPGLLCQNFVVYIRNSSLEILSLLNNKEFVQTLLDNENYLLKPLSYNFEEYQFELLIQRHPYPNPCIFQFKKTIAKETAYEIAQLKSQLQFVEKMIQFLKITDDN